MLGTRPTYKRPPVPLGITCALALPIHPTPNLHRTQNLHKPSPTNASVVYNVLRTVVVRCGSSPFGVVRGGMDDSQLSTATHSLAVTDVQQPSKTQVLWVKGTIRGSSNPPVPPQVR